MPEATLAALKKAYAEHVEWMHSHAEKLESGKVQHLEQDGHLVVNKSQALAEDFRHRANNLAALIAAYERITQKADERPR